MTAATTRMWTAPRVSKSNSPTISRPSRPRKTSRHGAGSSTSRSTTSAYAGDDRLGRRLAPHGVHARRTSRTRGLAAVPRHDELRSAHARARQPHDHGPRARATASTSSTPPTSTAGTKGAGATEEIVGRWFAQGGGRREKVVLATKVYGQMGDWPNESRLSALHIRARACEESLRRLQTDHIDLYQMHHIDRDAPWDEIWQAMEHARRSRARSSTSGQSNFAGWHIAQANEAATRRALPRARRPSSASTT